MSKIREFISTHYKSISVALLIFAIVVQSHYKFAMPVLATDSMWQLMSARALWEGHGISIISPDVNDLSAKVYTTQVHWAPGVPIVIYPFFYLTGENVVVSEWILTVICIIILFVTWFYLLQLLKPHVHDFMLPAMMLFWAFAFNPIRSLGLSDMLSLSSISVSFYFLAKLLLTSDLSTRKELLYVALASAAAFLSCFFRYAYYTIAFSIPAVMFIYGVVGKRKFLRYSLLSTVIIALLIVPEFKFMISDQQATANEDVTEIIDNVHKYNASQKIPWESLVYLDQIFTNGFFPEWVITKLFGSDGLHEPESFTGRVFLAVLSAFMGIIIIVGILSLLWGVGKTINCPEKKPNRLSRYLAHPVIVFLITGIIAIAANIGMLTYLELRYSSSPQPITYYGGLNYTRYYPITYIFMQIFVFMVLFSKNLGIRKFYKNLLAVVLISSFAFNIAHWGYIKMKFSWFDYESNLGMMKVPEGAPADYFLLQKAVAKNDLPVVFVGNNTDKPEVLNPKYKNVFMHVFAAVAGASMSNFKTILDSHLKTSKKIEVWIPVSTREPEQVLVDFCVKNNAVKKMTLKKAGYDIMSITVQPNL